MESIRYHKHVTLDIFALLTNTDFPNEGLDKKMY